MTRFLRLSFFLLAACSVAATAHADPAAPAPTTNSQQSAPAPSPQSAPAPAAAQGAAYPQSAPYPGAYAAPAAPYPRSAAYPGGYPAYPRSAAYPGSAWSYPAPRRDAATTTASTPRAGDYFVARPLAIYGHASLGGPYGWLGGSLNYSFSRYVALEAGAGLGAGGPEIGAMVLPRIPLSAGIAIGAGLGMAGEFGYQEAFACFMAESPCTPPTWSFAPFAQGELYLEGRTRSGFTVRGYLGEWRLLTPTPDNCSGPCTEAQNLSLPYLGVAFGKAFDL